METPTKLIVSRRALIARAKRALAKKGIVLYASTSESALKEFGEFYSVNEQNEICEPHGSLEEVLKFTDILQPWEDVGE